MPVWGPRSGRELPDAIEWHEGMLLAPQHFQQAFVRAEELVYYHALTGQPYQWGVRHLKTDPVTLVGGVFRILELEAVMPDGLIVTHMQGDDGPPLEIDLTARADELAGRPLTLYLAVPVRRLGGRPTSGELPRYRSSEGMPVVDEASGDNPLAIPRLRPRLSLEAGEQLAQKYAGFPIARVAMVEEAFSETNFQPPRLAVPSASPLGEICSGVARRLREKAVFLSERANGPNGGTAGAADLKPVLHGLVAGLPVLEALTKSDSAHPFQLYLALLQVVGHMTAVGGGAVPPVLPAYDHNDPLAAFQAAQRFAVQMLDRISESYRAIPFEQIDGGFALQLKPDWVGDALTVGVRARPGQTEIDVMAWMEGALVGDMRAIASMRERRVLGAGRRRIERDQSLDLSPSRGVVLFRVEADPEFIDPEGRLLLRGGDRSDRDPPVEAVLYVHADDSGEA